MGRLSAAGSNMALQQLATLNEQAVSKNKAINVTALPPLIARFRCARSQWQKVAALVRVNLGNLPRA